MAIIRWRKRSNFYSYVPRLNLLLTNRQVADCSWLWLATEDRREALTLTDWTAFAKTNVISEDMKIQGDYRPNT